MIVLSINTDTNEIHLISLPRDTYAKIPGIKGVYKLNASLDCGGGWPTEAGFNKVCEAASWMLGGIPVKYYYAVDMNAVKGLVDLIGGVDYNIYLNFSLGGRSYVMGYQHMGGQAVLDYLRVRKGIQNSGDLNRINRQKDMLVAIFEKLKSTNILLQLPDILGSFNGSLYTNTTLAQTAGLVAFAYKIGGDKVFMHSMDGEWAIGIFNWDFVITDQDKRVQLIKEVYGIDVPPNSDYDYVRAMALWYKMQAPVIRSGAKSVLAKVKKILNVDAKLPEYVVPTPAPPPTPTEPAPSEIETTSAAPSAESLITAVISKPPMSSKILFLGAANVPPDIENTAATSGHSITRFLQS